MDRYQRQRSHTFSEDIQGVNGLNKQNLNDIPKEINTNHRISLPPGTNKYSFYFS